MHNKDEFILVMDSGLGGLSVLRELSKILPEERFLYYGDSKNAPYGTRSTEEVRTLTKNCVEAHLPMGVKAVVIACNTATAAAIDDLRATYPDTIFIGMEPALKLAVDRHPRGKIVVMATNVTLRESKFTTLMDRFSDSASIFPLPCPGLVEFVESGKLHTPELHTYLSSLLEPVLGDNISAIVLGCTHFPFLKPMIQEVVGPNVEILDGSHGSAMQTRRRLEEAGLLRTGDGSVTLTNSLGSPEILSLSAKLLEIPL